MMAALLLGPVGPPSFVLTTRGEPPPLRVTLAGFIQAPLLVGH
jgi:hypothetical protein